MAVNGTSQQNTPHAPRTYLLFISYLVCVHQILNVSYVSSQRLCRNKTRAKARISWRVAFRFVCVHGWRDGGVVSPRLRHIWIKETFCTVNEYIFPEHFQRRMGCEKQLETSGSLLFICQGSGSSVRKHLRLTKDVFKTSKSPGKAKCVNTVVLGNSIWEQINVKLGKNSVIATENNLPL